MLIFFRMLALFTLCFVFSNTKAQAQLEEKSLVIIAHPDASSLDLDTARQLYTLKRKLLPDGARATLTMLPPAFEESIVFSQTFYAMYPYQLLRIWDTQVFSGKAVMPKELASPDAMIEYIIKTPNSIGYLMATESEITILKERLHVIASF